MFGVSPIESESSDVGSLLEVRQGNMARPDISSRLLQILREQKWRVLSIVTASIALGIILTMIQPRYYTAESRLEFKPEEATVQTLDTEVASALILTDQYFETQYELLRSRSVARDVAVFVGAESDLAFAEAFGVQGEEVSERRAVDLLLESLSVDPILESNLVDIGMTTRDPEYSARLANVWAETFIASDIERRFGATIQARDFLNTRLAETREKLQAAERDFIEFASRNRILNLPSDDAGSLTQNGPTLVSSQLSSLNDRLSEARAERIDAASRQRRSGMGANAVTSPALNQLRARRAELAARVAGMEEQYGSGYPPLQTAREELNQITSAISSEAEINRRGLEEDYRSALRAEEALQKEVSRLTQSLIDERRDGVQAGFLAREVDTNRQLYDALLQRVKEVGVAPTESSNIGIIENAEVPQGPSYPNPTLNIIAATLAGFVFAGLFVGGKLALDQVIRSPEELQVLTNRPVIGSMPLFSAEDAIDELSAKSSAIYEASLSTSLSLRHLLDGEERSVLITSSQAGEGKSMTAIGLCNALSQSGLNVLLVDADIRRGRLHSRLNLSKSPGLSDYIEDFDADTLPIRKCEGMGFDVIPVGYHPPNPAAAITSKRMLQLHQLAVAQYDLVLYDGPPVLGLVDAVHLAKMADLVVYAVQANEIGSRKIFAAENRLAQAGSAIDAFIMTRVPSSEKYGYDYSYSLDID
ncbi:GumC family protein [Altererythrobacter sp. MTPC7]|uniref:GumC family protein n=1 Tax=Altererythrobacter sp. MTPC7 TaxID=3056567 RepID=UPI0036F275C1